MFHSCSSAKEPCVLLSIYLLSVARPTFFIQLAYYNAYGFFIHRQHAYMVTQTYMYIAYK